MGQHTSDFQFDAASFGRKGFIHLNNSSTAVGDLFTPIQILTDGTLTATFIGNGDDYVAQAVAAGDIVYGISKDILFTGEARCYIL